MELKTDRVYMVNCKTKGIAILVRIVEPLEKLTMEEVVKYYGPKLKNPIHAMHLEVIRYIFARPNGQYVIIPECKIKESVTEI